MRRQNLKLEAGSIGDVPNCFRNELSPLILKDLRLYLPAGFAPAVSIF
jgi:hypothetical protein